MNPYSKSRVGCRKRKWPPAAAIYAHVPFCRAKCRYCDFYSLTDASLAEALVQAELAELGRRRGELAPSVRSVFVGGGTPTSLPPAVLGRLLAALHAAAHSGEAGLEFTVEANPGTLTPAVIDVLAGCGVNRVSLGVQSMDDRELATLGRIHTAADARSAVASLRAAGFGNISLDLIYGIPGQTADSWRASLLAVLEMSPEHLSCYGLSFEAGTPLAADLSAGRVQPADDELQRKLYDIAREVAAAAGLEHYEISNFARPQRRCRHNLTYWHNEPYLGIGPAAASYIGGVRRTNQPDAAAYIAALAAGNSPPAASESLNRRHQMAETLMLGLRLIDGVRRDAFAERFGQDPLDAFPQSIGRYRDAGALVVGADAIRIAAEYLFVADTVLADIVAEA
jgi:oxygen-independent coproporphyrinogen-3 oxidase